MATPPARPSARITPSDNESASTAVGTPATAPLLIDSRAGNVDRDGPGSGSRSVTRHLRPARLHTPYTAARGDNRDESIRDPYPAVATGKPAGGQVCGHRGRVSAHT